MCRWFSIFLLPYVVCMISAEQEERNSLTRPIHPRRHKRAEQVRVPTISRSPFVLWKNDPKCMIAGRDMMSCPKKNADDPYEKLICIEPQALCDDHQDCLGAEDEERHFCMFKKLEDAEMRRLKAEIMLLAQNNRKQQPEFKDVVVNNDETAVMAGIKQPDRPGIFKITGLGPLAKSKMLKNAEYEDDVNKSVEEEEEDENDENQSEEEEEEEEEEEHDRATAKREALAAIQHAKRRRTYRHLLNLKAANL